MKTIIFGWKHTTINERVGIVAAIIVSVTLSYLSIIDGYGVVSYTTIGPLILAAFGVQSVLTVGVLRMRSLALNHIFVDTLKELNDARFRLGQDIPLEIMDKVAGFLGDKK